MWKLYICEDRGLIAGSNVNLQWDRQQKTLYFGGQLIASLIIMAVLIYQKAIEESQCNFHFHECTSDTFGDDRGLRARFNVNLQWHRHKKTLYLGDQLIASLIIMAEVHQKAIEESVPFISMNLKVIHL